MIDVRRLAMLEALDRLGTIAAVADEMHLTAPGISMQLSALEREAAVPLTERQGRRLALTPAGRTLAGHGRAMLERLALAELEVDALRQGGAGRYRLAAFPSSARTIVAQAWVALRDARPALELELSTPEPEQALAALTRGAVDLAVVHDYSNVPRHLPDGLSAEALGAEPVLLAVREGGIGADGDLAALEDASWVAPTLETTCAQMVERACGLAGFRPRVVARSDDFAVQLQLVAAGVGVALVPSMTVAAVPEGVALVAPLVPIERSLFAVRRAARAADAGLGVIVEQLRAAMAGRTMPALGRPVA